MARRTKPNIARIDPYTPEVGLFKVRSKGEKRLQAEEFTATIEGKDGEEDLTIKYVTPYALNDVDMRIFLAAVAYCSDDPRSLNAENPEKYQKTLWDQFLVRGDAGQRDAATARTTSYALATAAGVGWGSRQKQMITDALERLSAVQTTWRRGNKVMSGSQMLSFAHDEDSGELALAVSPLLAKAILMDAGRYAKVSLEELRQLSQPAAAILHLILSGRLGVRKNQKKRDLTINIDRLSVAAYGEPKTPKMRRKRREYIRAALEELDNLDKWMVSFSRTTEVVSVTRWAPENIEHMMRNEDRAAKVQRQLDGIDPPDDIEE